MTFSPEHVRHLAAYEYNRINREKYNNGLPRWGTFRFRVTSGYGRVGCVRTVGGIVISMSISRQRETQEQLLNTIRHEIAHVAVHTYEHRAGIRADGAHGREFRFHANVCGANV